ncbi:MAG: crossover junction endodeoxyribonuclease RuvC [Candidatus Magasanikbacteria bacterium]|uniref:Crossover junction endodeoxyribonuclease RuvC n=1 Tax=Candidatus Magasanikbacteria bacterium CG10_big_fil_rev_8_21_14_0_10_38_6 TaxID=1974647 RepID=A0A2M6P1H2_9BACT|nr:crossover junction endodeoxyribonuclease RuvC [Candidatus Magasanikbacteria bacterium]NCS72374.1 crossover junction endodeoxyribonuclease RuvC [Candidatus Magasanikbacteria bacterium]PIR77547.1 MAG: crossover junction endodeoxyribonuclease RuvC [Candidatus Magasanikbacteria bacterium CG10_big_fil_rev_8_21_14_0_10_38_6]
MNSKRTIILGIDPGFGRVGWGVIHRQGTVNIPIAYGCIETTKTTPFVDRLEQIETELTHILIEYQPSVVGIESLFFTNNITTAIDVSHARGVILLTCKKHNARYIDITPTQVKQCMTGYGKADKKQMQDMVKRELQLDSIPKPDDAADALAIAITAAAMHKIR